MSGAKYTTETQTFTPVILPVVLGALVKCGTEAVAQAGRAVEMEQIIRENKRAYDEGLAQQRQQTDRAMQEYTQAMQEKVRELEQKLRSMGIVIPPSTGAAPQHRIQQLNQIVGNSHAAQQITPVFLNLREFESMGDWFVKITQLIDPILPEMLPCCSHLLALKAAAESALRREDISAIQSVYTEVYTLMPQAQAESNRKKSLKEIYDRELARAKALCRITKTLAPYPIFTLETAEQAILKLKEISARQFQTIEQIRQNPALRMDPDKRLKAQEQVSNKICAALANTGTVLERVSEIGNERVCWYRYGDAMLKVSVADTGFVSFEIVGHPDKKSGFKKFDENRVIDAMNRFKKEFPELQNQLQKQNATKTNCTVLSYEPVDIVSGKRNCSALLKKRNDF